MTATAAAPDTRPEITVERDRIENVPVNAITPAKDNPRRKVGDVAELAQSIAAVGLLEPLIVTPRDGGYLLVCGARRLAAAKKAGLATVPTIVRDLDERERQEAMLVENLQREDLTPLEEAEAYSRLVELGHTQRELAARIGRSQGHVSKRLTLLELPKAARKALDSGGIAIAEAVELGRLFHAYEAARAEGLAAIDKDRFEQFVAETIDEHPDYRDVKGDVETELRDLEHRRELAKTRAKLEAAGVRVLEPLQYGEPPKGATRIEKGGGWQALNLDPAKHSSEPCHAAMIKQTWQGSEVVYLCTDRKRHPKLTTQYERSQGDSSGSRAQEKRKAHDKELQTAAKGRREFIRGLLKKRPKKDEAFARVVDTCIEHGHQATLRIACELLELEPQNEQTEWGGQTWGYDTALRERAAKSDADLQRVALALALAGVEETSGSYWLTWGERHKAHIDFLAAHGYEVTAAEQLELDGKSPRR